MEDFLNNVKRIKNGAKDICDRNIEHFIGLCDMAVADKVVNEKEVERLINFCRENPEIISKHPVNRIYNRLLEILKDNIVDKEEEKELIERLSLIASADYDDCDFLKYLHNDILDNPEPNVEFEDNEFVLTGIFAIKEDSGLIEDTLKSLGAHISDKIHVKSTRYLVIGSIPSPEWKHKTFGRKIEEAMNLRKRGKNISIIHETHLVNEIKKKRI